MPTQQAASCYPLIWLPFFVIRLAGEPIPFMVSQVVNADCGRQDRMGNVE